jgi:2-keto-4-pentenoate hydratase/2-oxohepta-3-ene-1,7-dioic acid hydratase in catechol pathway
MKIACLKWQEGMQLGLVDQDGRIAVKETTPAEFWRTSAATRLNALERAATLAHISCAEARWLPPVPKPPKLICVAANYLEHMREGGGDEEVVEVRPQLFMKPPSTTLLGHNGTFAIPRTAQQLDWEAELAVIIGEQLYQASSREEAMKAVIGYSAFNDLSERALLVDPRQDVRKNTWFFDWLAGKWLNGSAPTGPWLVTADEIPDPQTLRIELRLNGQVMQSSTTAAMMNPVADIVWYASQVMTLEPGDIIATGTPAGVGAVRGVFIKPGDVVDVEIERIGTLTTRFAAQAG